MKRSAVDNTPATPAACGVNSLCGMQAVGFGLIANSDVLQFALP